jgi:hypothetical protein
MLGALLLGFALTVSAQSAPAPSPERALLAGMKAACGGAAWDQLQGWYERGRADLPGGRSVAYEAWHDIRTLRTLYAQSADGRIVGLAGYDGGSIWQSGPDGQVRRGGDPATVRRRLRDIYVSSFGFFFPDRFPATFAMLGTRLHEGRNYDVLQVTPANADSAELWVDQATHRIARIVVTGETAELSDYREFEGLCTATTGRQSDGDPAHLMVLHVENVVIRPIGEGRFSPPATPGLMLDPRR